MKPVVLLTGSTGYIGQNIVRLWSQQHELVTVCIDRLTGFDFSEPEWKVRLPERHVDIVIHLAQSRRYREFPAGAQDMFRVNVVSTVELLEWARTHGVRRFVFSSSGSVYVSHAERLTEKAECAPSSMYAATKLSAECLLQPYGRFFEIVIARLFSVYGPDQRHMLIPETIQRVRTGQEIPLAGGAGIYLTPLFIDDCVKAISTLAVTPLEKDSIVLNLAGDEVISLGEIVEQIASRLQVTPVIKNTNEPPKYICADNSSLKAYYRSALVPFTKGLDLTLSASC
jgi:nucleoside-diphosphate-sugar epimerase